MKQATSSPAIHRKRYVGAINHDLWSSTGGGSVALAATVADAWRKLSKASWNWATVESSNVCHAGEETTAKGIFVDLTYIYNFHDITLTTGKNSSSGKISSSYVVLYWYWTMYSAKSSSLEQSVCISMFVLLLCMCYIEFSNFSQWIHPKCKKQFRCDSFAACEEEQRRDQDTFYTVPRLSEPEAVFPRDCQRCPEGMFHHLSTIQKVNSLWIVSIGELWGNSWIAHAELEAPGCK